MTKQKRKGAFAPNETHFSPPKSKKLVKMAHLWCWRRRILDFFANNRKIAIFIKVEDFMAYDCNSMYKILFIIQKWNAYMLFFESSKVNLFLIKWNTWVTQPSVTPRNSIPDFDPLLMITDIKPICISQWQLQTYLFYFLCHE